MADKLATFKNVSNMPDPAKVGNVQINLDPLIKKLDGLTSVIAEGLKKDQMAAAMEVEQCLSDIGTSFKEKMDDVLHALTTISDTVVMSKDMHDATAAIVDSVAALEETIAKVPSHFKQIDFSPVVDALKSLNLKADIPITSVTVGLPKLFMVYAILSPFLFGLVMWMVLHFTSR